MRFAVLGALQVMDGERAVPVRGPVRRSLLGALLLRANQTVTADRLILDLWGDHPPGDPAGSLFAAVSRLRRSLGDRVETHAGGYRLQVDDGDVDAARFESLVKEGRLLLGEGRPERAAAAFREALSLWRGPYLADLTDLTDAQPERSRLAALRSAALEGRLEADLSAGRHGEMIPELESLVAAEPLRERLWSFLMLALYRSGRQADALAAYRRIERLLGEELGIVPGPELQALEERILLHDPALSAEVIGTDEEGNLPAPLSSFVGRIQEMAEVVRLVGSGRLVTLTGPGGAGKTRLATEAASRCRGGFPDGAWLVRLDPITTPGDVSRAVAEVLGLREVPRPSTDLAPHLRARRLLLVLDSCEHLTSAVADLVQGLLESCPRLQVLATSREPLGCPGEVVYRVGPLSLPDPDSADPVASLLSSESGQLLLARAATANEGLRLSPSSAALAARLCRYLDGLPLAVELAATRLRTIELADLVERLDQGHALTVDRAGAPTRHRTLDTTLAWSHDLLSPEEVVVFRRVSTFRGSFTLDGAEAVAGAGLSPGSVAHHLGTLVDRSLVERDHAGGRYRLLETVRRFGLSRLDEAGETAPAADRHADHVLSLAVDAAGRIQGPAQVTWLAVLEREHDDIRAAHEHLVRFHHSEALTLVGALWWFWFRHGHVVEGRRLLQTALDALPEAPDPARALAEVGVAHMAWFQGEYRTAEQVGARALHSALRSNHTPVVVTALAIPALVARDARDDLEEAEALLQRRLASARRLADPWITATSLSLLATLASSRADLAALARLTEEARRLYSELGDTWGLSWCHLHGAQLAVLEGRHRDGVQLCREAISDCYRVNHRAGMTQILPTQAAAEAAEGAFERAAVLLGMIRTLQDVTGVALPLPERDHRRRTRDLLAEEMGTARLQAAIAEGAALRYEEMADFAIGEHRRTPHQKLSAL